MSQQDARLW